MPESTPNLKVCTLCRAEKPATPEYFARKRGGLDSRCKSCKSPPRRQETVRLDTPKRTCNKCHRTYPNTYEHFHYANKAMGQLRPTCRECRVGIGRQAYLDNREHVLEQHREWKASNHDRRRAADREWRRRHPASELKNRDPEAYRLYMAKWRGMNRHATKAYAQKRRALKLGSLLQHGPADVKRKMEQQNRRCYWCRQAIVGDAYQVDHIFALSRGGSNGPENICISCRNCNARKHAKEPFEFIGRLF